MNSNTSVSDLFTSKAQFEDMLARAEENAKNAWEEEFVSDLRVKFEKYGMEMFISDKQEQTLTRIAEG